MTFMNKQPQVILKLILIVCALIYATFFLYLAFPHWQILKGVSNLLLAGLLLIFVYVWFSKD